MTAASSGAAGQVPDLSAETPGPVLTVPGAPLAFHVMAKPTGAVCNLDCEYCFFLSKEMLYPGSRFRMAADLQETYIRQLLEAHARVARASVHGVPDALRGASVVALLWLKPLEGEETLTATELMHWCRARLQPYKTPRHLYVCTRWAWTGSGKTDHATLARWLALQMPSNARTHGQMAAPVAAPPEDTACLQILR